MSNCEEQHSFRMLERQVSLGKNVSVQVKVQDNSRTIRNEWVQLNWYYEEASLNLESNCGGCRSKRVICS